MQRKIIIASVLFFIGMSSGYLINDWKRDSEDFKIQKKVDKFLEEQRQKQLEASLKLEEKLKELKANERVIHTKEKEIVERPIYRNVCVDDDGLSILNQYGTGKPN